MIRAIEEDRVNSGSHLPNQFTILQTAFLGHYLSSAYLKLSLWARNKCG